eukprot:Lankesteria_metandrocarpae@DN7092_c0_g1_i1.p1
MGKDYYAILGVNRSATDDDLKKAYRKLAVKWHPDKHAAENKNRAEEMFKDIAEAYDVLSDKERRGIYDRYGEEGLKGSGGSGGGVGGGSSSYVHYSGVDPSDVFAQFFRTERGPGGGRNMSFFFGGDDFGAAPFGPAGAAMNSARGFHGPYRQAGGRQQQQEEPKKFYVDLNLTLEELYTGCTKRLKVTRTRWSERTERKEDNILQIDVTPGWKDGTKITYNREGDQEGPNGVPGDVVFVVKTKSHPLFVRDGHHLLHRVKIPLSNALLGCTVPIRTIDGRTIQIKMDEVINPKTRRIVPNAGMPQSKQPGERGDLIVEFDIEFPRSLATEQRLVLAEVLRGR